MTKNGLPEFLRIEYDILSRKRYRCLWTLSVVMILILIAPNAHSYTAHIDEIRLENPMWTVTIVLQTLKIVSTPKKKKEFILSSPLEEVREVRNVFQQDNQVEWEFFEEGLKVSVELNKRELLINIHAPKNDQFAFPIIEQSENLKALILPHWQGIYAPLNNPMWRTILSKKEFDTLEGLTMPFFGLDIEEYTVTYIVTNRYNNEITFKNTRNNTLQTRFTHHFPRNSTDKKYGFVIRLSERYSPIEPAKEFRKYLISTGQFVSMKEKAETVPKVERLLGAIHAYLWGDMRMSFDDVYQHQWRSLCQEIVTQAASDSHSPGKRIQELLDPKDWEELKKLSTLKYPFMYIKAVVAAGFSKMLSAPDFYQQEYFTEVKVPEECRELLSQNTPLTQAQIFRKNGLLFHAAFPEKIRPPDEWGYGYSVRMLHELQMAGIERARLVHDLWDFGMIDYRPQVAMEADKMGYLLGPYDSFNSIHDPKYWGTDHSWATAQFDQELFEKGSIVLWNGKTKSGFQNKGGRLSPIVARPWVEKRVQNIMNNTPYNSYFIDCDAWGEVFDDYSPFHPATQEDDANARVSRMKWIRDTFHVVIGSEGGSSYAAPVIHVAEGMMSTAFGKWQDADFGNRKSPYYLGRHYPLHGPEFFFQQVPLKEEFVFFHYDPRFRLPLNEIVFHDSFVSTNHYGSANRKFKNIQDIVELTSLLYLVPPMYHFNIEEFKENKEYIKKQYEFFSPIHKEKGFAQMTDFIWLTDDHFVQKTLFEHDLEMVANFTDKSFEYLGISIPAKSILARWMKSGEHIMYTATSSM